MKLHTKLLLGVGVLLSTMMIIIYIVPTLFIRRDVFVAANEIHALLIADQQQLVNSQRIWLENNVQSTKQNNDALLLMIFEEARDRKAPFFSSEMSDEFVWTSLARVAGYDPTIDFLQAHAPHLNKTAAILPHATHLYPIANIVPRNREIEISIIESEKENTQENFRALVLPDALQTLQKARFYLLLAPDINDQEIQEIEQQMARMAQSDVLKDTHHNSSANLQKDHDTWMIKIAMMRTLTPFFFFDVTHTKEPLILGLARVDDRGNGFAILAKEAYSTKPLFDDAHYYKFHQPPLSAPPLATDSALIALPDAHAAYLGNILLSNDSYLTIGTSLSTLAHQLALSSNKIILLNVYESVWLGYDRNGVQIPDQTVAQIVPSTGLNEKAGMVQFRGQSYFYNQIASLENGKLTFFDIHPIEGEQTIASTLFSLEDRLSNRISLQLLLISLGTMVLVLLFIGRIGFTVIQPISKLASATQFVMTGRYSEVLLPDMGDREDEVAILTHSFGEMVMGLQEREKIRGVLDKVVSKDVADEILRTQIHLGGEDRIVTILFSDIRGFSHLTASESPQKTIALLNACMTKVSRVIEGEGGVIDKYVGDAVMAIYGAPTTHPDHALRAISTGILIIETLKAWNQQRTAVQEPVIEMGIGIHTGLVVAGNMGSEDRLNYTVLGANVNLAERLCEIAKPNQLLISAATLAQPNIANSFHVQELEPIKVKGFIESIEVYEVLRFKWDGP